MTPSQLIHLARVASRNVYKDFYGDVRLHTYEPYQPHTPEGAAQFRELWVAIPQEKRDQVVKWWFHENPPARLADREDFMTWVFKNPDEACQIIFEVTGGKEK